MEEKDVVHKFLDLVLFNLELGLYKNNELCIQFLNYFELKKYAKALSNDYKIEDRSFTILYEHEFLSNNEDIVISCLNKYGDLNQISIMKIYSKTCFYKEHYRKEQKYLKYVQYSENIFDEVSIEMFNKRIYKHRHVFE